MEDYDAEAIAKSIIDANRYMTLGTADATGRPWVSPVYYGHDGYTSLFWISSPDALHSRNIGLRSELSIVVFDSRAPVGTGQGVYMAAIGREVAAFEVEAFAEVAFRPRFEGVRTLRVKDLRPPAPQRLYMATVTRIWVLNPDLAGGRADNRIELTLSRG